METLVSEFSRVISFRKCEWLQISTNTERKYTAHLTNCLGPEIIKYFPMSLGASVLHKEHSRSWPQCETVLWNTARVFPRMFPVSSSIRSLGSIYTTILYQWRHSSTMSFIGWMCQRGLLTRWVSWCTAVFMVRHLSNSPTISPRPATSLLGFVCVLQTVTSSLYLAVVSTHNGRRVFSIDDGLELAARRLTS